MATDRSQQRLLQELTARYGPEVSQSFMAAVEDLRSTADLQRVIASLEAGDIDEAIRALRLDAAAYNDLREKLRQAYMASGQSFAGLLPKMQSSAGEVLVIRFDGRNPRAETWLAEESSELITRIVADQRLAARNFLTAGMAQGNGPRTTALDLVGRIDRATGTRVGGVLGLTVPQEEAVRRARSELSGGDATALRNYLGRARRDKRYDRAVRRAIETGEPVPAETARRAIRAYENRLLQLRGETVARKETMTAIQAARHEAWLQAVENGAIAESQVRRTWRTAGDTRVRHSHHGMNGDTVGLRQPFTSPSGARLMYPGDTSLGAGLEEVINCRCDVAVRVDFLANIR